MSETMVLPLRHLIKSIIQNLPQLKFNIIIRTIIYSNYIVIKLS